MGLVGRLYPQASALPIYSYTRKHYALSFQKLTMSMRRLADVTRLYLAQNLNSRLLRIIMRDIAEYILKLLNLQGQNQSEIANVTRMVLQKFPPRILLQ